MGTKLVYEARKKRITHTTEEDSLITHYDLEYTTKSVPRTKPYVPPELLPELKEIVINPISEPFRQELLPDYERNRKEDREHFEGGTTYFNRLKERKPSILKVIDKEVNQEAVATEHELFDDRTVYQIDYCQINDYFSDKTDGMKPQPVPDCWKPIPLDFYRLNYRDHTRTADWKIVPDPAHPPPSFFDPNPQEREILQVRLGESEYNDVIGRLGNEVIQKEYHGRVKTLPGEFLENK